MVNWKDIHSNFNEELVQKWQNEGFDLEQTKKWIEVGFNPNDYELVSFVKGNLGYEAETSLSNSDIEVLRSIHRNDLETQSILLSENVDEQEVIRRSIFSQEGGGDFELQEALFLSQEEEIERLRKEEQKTDMGWLTDDNIEYILQKDEAISKNKEGSNTQIKTDLANIYLQVEKAKKGELVDEYFWNSLDTSKRYILLPLRVRGIHWSLLIFVNDRHTNKVLWLRYISSHPSPAEVSEEVKEIGGFLRQAVKKYGNDIFNNNTFKEIVSRGSPKQRNTWDCGVYLIMSIKFLCVDEYHNLNEENLPITAEVIKEFRDEWRQKIGENKWCKWDEASSRFNAWTVSTENNRLNTGKKQDNSPLNLERGNIEKEIAELKNNLQNLMAANKWFLSKLKEVKETNRELEERLSAVEKNVFQLNKTGITNEIRVKKEELNKIVGKARNKLEDEELLDEFLEAHKEFIQSNNSFVKKQLERSKNKLLKTKKISEEEVNLIWQKNEELARLEKEIEQQLESRIEINNK